MEIVQYPHPALRWKSKSIQDINADLRVIVREMFALMYAAKGIGLAANQVGLPYRLFVINLSSDEAMKDEEVVFINPQIIRRKGNVEDEEGCLSLPNLYGQVRRSQKIVVDSFDLQGRNFEYELTDLASRAVQHEADHLDGVLFFDRMSDPNRREIEPQLTEFEAYFRRLQESGKYPSDEEIERHLRDIEPE